MIMMLPFFLAALSIWTGIRGNRGACLSLWLLTMIIFVAWSKYHMTDALNISL
jgi:hypothetical protein